MTKTNSNNIQRPTTRYYLKNLKPREDPVLLENSLLPGEENCLAQCSNQFDSSDIIGPKLIDTDVYSNHQLEQNDSRPSYMLPIDRQTTKLSVPQMFKSNVSGNQPSIFKKSTVR